MGHGPLRMDRGHPHCRGVPPAREEHILAAVGKGLTCCSVSPSDISGGRSQPDWCSTAGARGTAPGWASKGFVHSLASPFQEETGELPIFLFFSLFFSPQTGTIVLDMIIPIRQLDFFGMLDSCLRTNTLWGSRLWRRLEKALPLREQIREVLQLLFHVLG